MSVRLADILIAARPYEPDGPSYVSLRVAGAPPFAPPLRLVVSIPGARRALRIRTWDDADPLLRPIAYHRLGGMLGSAGCAYTAAIRWSPAYELTLEDGGRFPPGTHVELFGCDRLDGDASRPHVVTAVL